ncbi:hypothetical protein [Roseibium sp.]|uniref:hypothetical protein n=1 Tax=Roseibium sp. TaxID=1936156 RepID=UPI003A9783A4
MVVPEWAYWTNDASRLCRAASCTFRTGAKTKGHDQLKIALGVLLAAIFVAAPFLSLNYSGYCLSEQRFLTKDELIESTLRDAYRSVFEYPYSSLNVDEEIHMKNIREYIKNNPDCCKILRNFQEYKAADAELGEAYSPEGYFYPTFWGRIWGDENYLVQVRYTGKRQNGGVFEQSGPRVIYRMIGTCGKIKDYL